MKCPGHLASPKPLYPPGQPKKALGHQPQIDLCVANQATATALLASETDRRRRYSIRMQPRWKHARSAALPNVSSHAQGLEDKEISSPSSRGRKMSLTSPLIEQALAQACGVCSPKSESRRVAEFSNNSHCL